MGAKELAELAMEVAKPIKQEKGFIKVVSHFDADGICSGAIIYKALETLGKSFELSFVKQLELDVLKDIVKKPADLYIFTDLGSGQLNTIRGLITDKPIVVIDHHQHADLTWEKLYHINPYLVGIDGKDEISGAGLTYIVSRILTSKVKPLIELAVVGATGDMQQTDTKYKGVNKLLLEDAIAQGIIKHEKGLRLYGRYSRPIHKALEYWDDPVIPDISGSESGAVQFLAELGIPIKKSNGTWRTLADLSLAEQRRLATALILEGAAVGNGFGSLIGDVYRLKNNYEIREFSTILNACGRIEKPLEGLRLCLGLKEVADDIIFEYKRKVAKYLDWVRRNKNKFYKTDKAAYILAGDSINENFIGTVMSMAIRSVFSEPIIFGFANASNGVKVSARAKSLILELNLGKAIKQAAEQIEGAEGGGHMGAAGAKIPFGTEQRFIQLIDGIIVKQLEQNINKVSAQNSCD